MEVWQSEEADVLKMGSIILNNIVNTSSLVNKLNSTQLMYKQIINQKNH